MKILMCDVEGTIFKAEYRVDGVEYASTMWQPLARCLGEAAVEEEKQTHAKWKAGHYQNYTEWVKATVEIHRKYQLHVDDFNRLIEEAEYEDGVIEFFQGLNRREFIPVLVSGGFQELVGKAQRDLKINYGFGACEYIFHPDDGYLAEPRYTPCDFEGKFDYVKNLFSLFNLTKDDLIFVGDGKNDVHVAKKAALSFGINAHDELRQVVHHNVSSFREIALILKELERNLTRPASPSGPKELRKQEGRSVSVVQRQEHPLAAENAFLKDENKKIKQALNDLQGKLSRKGRVEDNELSILETDYLTLAARPLVQILDGVNVVLFGFQEEHDAYKYFASLHKNMRVIEGSKKTFRGDAMKHVDVIFIHRRYMGHSASWRAENLAMASVPYAILKREINNIERLENAMANVLARVSRLKDEAVP
jgi:phosphoserine phosphatase